MERGLIVWPILIGVNCLNLGFQIGKIVAEGSSNTDKRVENIQTYNEEVGKQLAVGDRVVAHLVLNDGNRTFKFQTVDASQQREECTGGYTVINDTATATGKLACTVMTPIR